MRSARLPGAWVSVVSPGVSLCLVSLSRRWSPVAAGSAAAVGSVIPSFGVEFTGGDGGCCRGRLGELWSTRFERVAPVRAFPPFRGQVSFPGLYYAVTMDAHVGFESWLERDVAMMLDFDPAVVAFSSQPFWLTWEQDGSARRHAPDYFAGWLMGRGGGRCPPR